MPPTRSKANSKPKPTAPPKTRVLLKLSGESLAGDAGYGIDPKVVESLGGEIIKAVKAGVQVAIVVGGGNIFRGLAASAKGMDRATADYMGMLATVMNALALQDALEALGCPTRVQSAIEMQAVAEPYIRRRAMRHLEKGRIVIFAAGTGNPYFTTDTTAALRALEIDATLICKATKVDGVYDKDPAKHADAKKYATVTFHEALQKRLGVMDSTAFALCMDNNLPIVVFDITAKNGLFKALTGKSVGTVVRN